MRYAMDAKRHAAIFGRKVEESGSPGRTRLCKVCGDWHSLSKPWPHNCRPPVYTRQHLAAPKLAPTFEAFMTGQTDTAEYIGDRKAKREYMARNDLVEYDEGVRSPDDHWTAAKEDERQLGELMRDISQTDTDYLSDRVGFDVTDIERVGDKDNLDDGSGIEADSVEIIE